MILTSTISPEKRNKNKSVKRHRQRCLTLMNLFLHVESGWDRHENTFKTIERSIIEGVLIISCHCAGMVKRVYVVSKSPKKVYQSYLSQAGATLPIRRYLAKSGDVSSYHLRGVIAGSQ